jgi:fucose 4-O-acetylase-like acetyltransferase
VTRAYYVDRIRVILTALVVLHHTAITYGAPGGWYYRELPTTASLTGILLVLFVSVNQAYFMGFFFLLAGYFTPAAYQRKGLAKFALDRLVRLGIPLAIFAILLDPLTNSIAEAWGETPTKPDSFLPSYLHRISNRDWHPGPLWFAEALLIFSIGYVVRRQCRGPQVQQPDSPMPSSWAWFLSAVEVGAGALLIRQWIPVGKDILELQLGYFSSYTFLFALGTVAWQRDWFERLIWKRARPWFIVSIIGMPVMVAAAIVLGLLAGKKFSTNGGLSIGAILYAFWEPFVAWGIIAAYLVWFREHANRASVIWEYLGARAYAVYILHAPVLVAVSVAFRPWHAPALVKIAVIGTLAIATTLGVSSLCLHIPGARRVM